MSEYLDSHQEIFQEAEEKYIEQFNSEWNELNKQVAIFIAILLPLSTLIFTSERFSTEITLADQLIGGGMLISFVIALLASALQFFFNADFLDKNARKVRAALDELYEADFDDNEEEEWAYLNDLFRRTEEETSEYSNDIPIKIAYAYLCIGLVCLVILMFKTFLMPVPDNVPQNPPQPEHVQVEDRRQEISLPPDDLSQLDQDADGNAHQSQ